MLNGCDLSHWNYPPEIPSWAQFAICKATEGANYRDPRCEWYIAQARSVFHVPFGVYHYARPDINEDATKEADHFLNFIAQFEVVGDGILCLDYEGKALNVGKEEWALSWLRYVYRQTGVKPLLYIHHNWQQFYKKVAEEDYGLWLCHWTGKPTIKDMDMKRSPWKIWALWQYSAYENIDKDLFNGTVEQFKKYAEVKK